VGGCGSRVLNFLVKIHIQSFALQASRNVLTYIVVLVSLVNLVIMANLLSLVTDNSVDFGESADSEKCNDPGDPGKYNDSGKSQILVSLVNLVFMLKILILVNIVNMVIMVNILILLTW